MLFCLHVSKLKPSLTTISTIILLNFKCFLSHIFSQYSIQRNILIRFANDKARKVSIQNASQTLSKFHHHFISNLNLVFFVPDNYPKVLESVVVEIECITEAVDIFVAQHTVPHCSIDFKLGPSSFEVWKEHLDNKFLDQVPFVQFSFHQ